MMSDRGMVRATAIVLALAVSGCGKADQLQNADAEAAGERIELLMTKIQDDGVRFVADFTKEQQAAAAALVQVKKAMEKYLFDPSSAKYAAIQVGRNGSVCGQYNAKNRYNAYVGFKDFVMASDGRVYASDSNGGIEESLSPSYIQAYLESCATKAQITAHKQSAESHGFGRDSDDPPMTYDEDAAPDEQEPDQILDAPPARKRPEVPANIPTA